MVFTITRALQEGEQILKNAGIKNYKIDSDELSLDNMRTRMLHINSIRKDKDLPNLKLFGVRTGDVKKLGSAWINFEKFF